MLHRKWFFILLLLACSSKEASKLVPIKEFPSPRDSGNANPISKNYFDSCGGKIVSEDGSIRKDEYIRQSTLFDQATLNCRLGPTYKDLYGEKTDDRPTAFEPTKKSNPGGCTAPANDPYFCRTGYPNYYQYGSVSKPDSGAYGQIFGQVLYAPDDEAKNSGIDDFFSFTWNKNAIALEPWISHSPSIFTSDKLPKEEQWKTEVWKSVFGTSFRKPVAVARSQLGEVTGGLAIFPNGYIGGLPDIYFGATNQLLKLPEDYVPTHIAQSNANEFAFVTAWNTKKQTGHLFVLALQDALPHPYNSRIWSALPNPVPKEKEELAKYADQAPIKIIANLELPISSPTHIAVSFDNGNGHRDTYLGPHILGNRWDNGLDYGQQSTRDSLKAGDTSVVSNAYHLSQSGYAVILSRWENKAVFVDLQPISEWVRKYFAGNQDQYLAARNNRGNKADQWPWTLEVEKSKSGQSFMPIVAGVMSVPHPLVALAGRFGAIVNMPIKAHIASLDGTVRTFEVGSLGSISKDEVKVSHLSSVTVGPNPISMVWPRATDPKGPMGYCPGGGVPCASVSRNLYNDHFVVASRAEREIDFVVTVKEDARIYRKIRDSRMNDPVAIYPSAFDYANVISVADWSGKKIINYRIGDMDPQLMRPIGAPIGAGKNGSDDFECGGELSLAGHPYGLSLTNIP